MSAKLERLAVERLFLDPQNARLPSYLRGASETKIIEFMLLEASTLELMQAIAKNGFFEAEQLLVVPLERGNFKVVEGNRRLTAVKLLRDPSLASVQQTKVQRIFDEAECRGADLAQLPCLIFQDEQIIHRYLGYRHITGIQPWNLRQRARYLDSLKQELFSELPLDEACRELAKIIGSRRDYVKRVLVGFQIYTVIEEHKFFRVRGLDEESFYFTYIADSLNKPKISSFLGVDLESPEPIRDLSLPALKQWTTWFFEKSPDGQTRVKARSEDLKQLNAVLGNQGALQAFADEGRSLKEAYELTPDIRRIFRDSIARAIVDLERADGVTHKLPAFYGGLEDDLKSIARLIRKIKDAKDQLATSEIDDDYI